jgi:cholesterol transport system auxiliary component
MKKILLLLVLLSGCATLTGKNAPAVVNYVWQDKIVSNPTVAPSDPRSLLVLDTTTTAFYDDENLVYSSAPGTRSQYQYARWTERPGKRFSDLLRARLEAQSGFASIATAGGHVRGDLLLDTELSELYHDAETSPGSVRILLRAELIDLETRKLISRKWFERRVPVSSYDAVGAAQGFNQASSGVLDDLVAWIVALPK